MLELSIDKLKKLQINYPDFNTVQLEKYKIIKDNIIYYDTNNTDMVDKMIIEKICKDPQNRVRVKRNWEIGYYKANLTVIILKKLKEAPNLCIIMK